MTRPAGSPQQPQPMHGRKPGLRVGPAVLLVLLLAVAAAAGIWVWDGGLLKAGLIETGPSVRADPEDSAQVARGLLVYQRVCANCHGAHLEGEPNWKRAKANGRMPAPPQDATGHTWHHSDAVLFSIVKDGMEAFVPLAGASDMPGYKALLGDGEIWDVLAYIEASWPPDIRRMRAPHSQKPKP